MRQKKMPTMCTRKVRGVPYGYARFPIGNCQREERSYGRTDSPEELKRARSEFLADLLEWQANGERFTSSGADTVTVQELTDLYRDELERRHGKGWLDRDNGSRSNRALCNVTDHFGDLDAASFDCAKLAQLQRALIDKGKLCRNEINARTRIVKACFRWGAQAKHIPTSVAADVALTDTVKRGEAGVRENAAREGVPWALVEKTLPHLPKPHDTIVRLLWMTAARPSEILRLRAGQIDRSDAEQWVAVLTEHKTSHRCARPRVLVFDKAAQKLLAPFLMRPDSELLFPNREGEPFHHSVLRIAIRRACDRAGIKKADRWTPYALRHGAATEAAERGGRDVARDLLGHASDQVTVRYVHEDAVAKAKAAAKKRAQ